VLKRLKREFCAQAQVRHPAVVTIIDQVVDGARPYVVMDLLSGSLRDRLEGAGGKSLPVAQSIRTFLQLSYALRAAHASGLTHHNLKPENVLFDVYGNAKLGDFGLSRVIEVEPGKGLPQVFVGTGSMSYLAPELITRKDAGPASDVYGLGILLYEMLTGGIPGRRSPLPSEVNAEVPSKLDPIFDKMTQDRRESRYPDFDAMLDEFYGRSAMTSSCIAATWSSPPSRPGSERAWGRWPESTPTCSPVRGCWPPEPGAPRTRRSRPPGIGAKARDGTSSRRWPSSRPPAEVE
jgi:serine/threonine protein kinase